MVCGRFLLRTASARPALVRAGKLLRYSMLPAGARRGWPVAWQCPGARAADGRVRGIGDPVGESTDSRAASGRAASGGGRTNVAGGSWLVRHGSLSIERIASLRCRRFLGVYAGYNCNDDAEVKIYCQLKLYTFLYNTRICKHPSPARHGRRRSAAAMKKRPRRRAWRPFPGKRGSVANPRPGR